MQQSWFERMAGQYTIRRKMVVGFMLLLGLILFLLVVSGVALKNMQNGLSEIVEQRQPSMDESARLLNAMRSAEAHLGYYLLNESPERKQAYSAAMQQARRSLLQLQGLLRSDSSEEGKGLKRDVQLLEKEIERFSSFETQMFSFAEQPLNNLPALKFAADNLNPIAVEVLQMTTAMIDAEEEETADDPERLEILMQLQLMRYHWANMLNEVRGYLSFRLPGALQSIEQYLESFGSGLNRLQTEFADQLVFEQEESVARLQKYWQTYKENYPRMVELHGSEQWRQDAYIARTELDPILQNIENRLNALLQYQQESISRKSQSLLSAIKQSLNLSIGLALFAVVSSLIGYRIMLQTIQKPLDYAVSISEHVASGDLSTKVQVNSQDEFGHLLSAMRDMMEKLSGLVSDVQHSGIQVTTSSTKISSTSQQQEASLSQQAASTNEIMATAKQINASSSELCETMQNVNQATEQTANSATQGQQHLEQMELGMGQMAESTGSVVSRLQVLDEKAVNISSVVTTITKIADQTNLLSLNAAIEAEKAGEYGVGFAVVASEIRRLADQTAVATWDIEQMVRDMQSAVSSSVRGIEQFAQDVRENAEKVRQIGQNLSIVMEQIQRLRPSFELVEQGMKSHIASSSQIEEAIGQLNESAQESVQSIRYSNQAIAELNEAAQRLQTGITFFKTRNT